MNQYLSAYTFWLSHSFQHPQAILLDKYSGCNLGPSEVEGCAPMLCRNRTSLRDCVAALHVPGLVGHGLGE